MANNYPITLSHGIARFDFLSDYFIHNLAIFGLDVGDATDQGNYFKGIRTFLRSKGFDVHSTRVSFAAGVDVRSEDLRNEVNRILAETGKEKVHIIGHSMGGMDARHMIVEKGMAQKVASLTTIGTPHNGTSFADWGIAHGGDEIVKIISKVIHIEGLKDLTRDACRKFNDAARNAEASNDVVYKTYAATEDLLTTFTPLQLSWQIIHKEEGENDGLVPLTSQQWQSELKGDDGRVKKIEQKKFKVPGDHLNEVGWWDLNELVQLKFQFNIKQAARDYEQKIKDTYLEIATAAASL
ncbi:MAG: alpha/beta fold hydrolase [Pyrinomonadaceae bacterium]